MEAPQWPKLLVRGDLSAIAREAEVSVPVVFNAVYKAKGKIKVLRIVKRYFDNRKKFLQEYANRKKQIANGRIIDTNSSDDDATAGQDSHGI